MKLKLNIKTIMFVLVFSFILLTITVSLEFTRGIDERGVSTLYISSDGTFRSTIEWLTHMGSHYILLPGLAAVLFLFYKFERRFIAFSFGSMMFLSIPINVILKFMIRRPRPYLGTHYYTSFSYPSGHTVGAFTFFIGFYIFYSLIYKERHDLILLTICATLASIVGLSRVLLGVHYPTDVIGSVLLSGIIITSFSLLYHKYFKFYEQT